MMTHGLSVVVMTSHDFVLLHVMNRPVRHGVNACHRDGDVSGSLGKCAGREETGDEDGEQLVHWKSCESMI